MTTEPRSTLRAWLERLLLVVGVVCLGYYGLATLEARQQERRHAAAVERMLAATAPVAEAPLADAVAPATATGASAAAADNNPPADVAWIDGALGVIEIPRLDLSAPVLSGDDAATLRSAVGHLPDTPRPWEDGNAALAAHRDGLFRPLRHVRVGDRLRMRTPHGALTYEVRSTEVVSPTDLSVLAPTEAPTLTLITCYPFNYVGPAPKRFIVRAERVAP